MNAFVPRLGVLVRSAAFQNTTLALIVANALLMGLETSSTLLDRWGAALIALEGPIRDDHEIRRFLYRAPAYAPFVLAALVTFIWRRPLMRAMPGAGKVKFRSWQSARLPTPAPTK